MFIQQYVSTSLFLLAVGVSSANGQTSNNKKAINNQQNKSNTEQLAIANKNKAKQDENQIAYNQNEDFDLDKYINSIDWEAERESILKWYSTIPEDKNNGDKK